MATSLFFVLRVFLLSFFTFCVSQETKQDPCQSTKQMYYVSKNGTDSLDCLRQLNYPIVPCATLSYLKHNIFNCSNFQILDDEIVLTGEMLFDASSIGIGIIGNRMSDQKVNVYCEGSGGLLFLNSSGVLLENLHFDGCSFSVLNYLLVAIRSVLSSYQSSILLQATYNVHIVRCSFANHLGSAILLVNVEGTISIKESAFNGNMSLVSETESRSGGIVLWQSSPNPTKSSISFESCEFSLNLNMNNSTQCHDDDFYSDIIRHGGAIDINLAPNEGSIISILIVDCNFTDNHALGGGAVGVFFTGSNNKSSFTFLRSNFISNSACFQGGAVLFSSHDKWMGFASNLKGSLRSFGYFQVELCVFTRNYASWGGGLAAWCEDCDSYFDIDFIGCTWQNNSAYRSGFAIGLEGLLGTKTYQSFLITARFSGNSTFIMNTAINNSYEAIGALSIDSAEVIFRDGITHFVRNVGTAILMKTVSIAQFLGDVNFFGNAGFMGGAILLQDDSYMSVGSSGRIIFSNNTAFVLGGAIFSKVTRKDKCAFDFTGSPSSNISIFFTNNQANGVDQSVFVRGVEACDSLEHLLLHGFNYSPDVQNQVIFPLDSVNFSISPEDETLHVMLGEKFYLNSIEIIDRYGRNSNGMGYLFLSDISTDYTLKGPMTISLDNFTVNTELFIEGIQIFENTNFQIELFYDREGTYRMGSAITNLTVIPCRLGYRYSNWRKICMCKSDNNLIKCPIDSRTLCVKDHYWYSNASEEAIPCPARNCIYSKCSSKASACPNSTGYCSIQHPDDLCWMGRGGLLCSLCASNYSFTFAAFKCVPSNTCSNANTLLLIGALIVYWFFFTLLVLIILKLKLGIGSGFMYGIVYYFSVVSIYTSRSALFSTMWLRMPVLISKAITQLDPQLLGFMFRTCFIKGWNTRLPHLLFNYVTPLFVITLILAIIFISRYFRLPKRVSFSENSPIHAICMLVLFSYTSLSYTNFKILIPMHIEGRLSVQIAPTVRYFDPRSHIPYALVAICVELFISLPICFFLLFATCISRRVDLVKWRLKPILDEFQACYRPECRWFVGFYFLARQLVYLFNGVSQESSPQNNSVLVTMNILILIIHTSFQPYRKKWLNILDTVLLIDILLLSMSSVALVNSDQAVSVNRFIQSQAFPYALVLLPTFYLIGALGGISLKRKGHMLKHCCHFPRHFLARIGQTHRSVPSRTSITISEEISEENKEDNSFSEAKQFPSSYYKDDGFREPLLEDCASIKERDSAYGTGSQQPPSITSTSLRVSMNQFPIFDKS